jgi:hypothetical protein
MRATKSTPDPELAAALTAARIAVTDLLRFVGVIAEEARAATREKAPKQQKPEVPVPPSAHKARFRQLARRSRAWFG